MFYIGLLHNKNHKKFLIVEYNLKLSLLFKKVSILMMDVVDKKPVTKITSVQMKLRNMIQNDYIDVGNNLMLMT